MSDDIDITSFITLANEALADLHEVAFLEAAPIYYKGDAIKRTNDYFETTLDKIYVGNQLIDSEIRGYGLVSGRQYYKFELPFEYSKLANTLIFEAEELKTSKVDVIQPRVKQEKTNLVIVDFTGITPADAVNKKIKFFNRIMRANGRNGFYETIIKLPDNFSTMIKLEAYDTAQDVYVVEGSSINSMDFNN